MLKDAVTLAIRIVETAENEPPKVSLKWDEMGYQLPSTPLPPTPSGVDWTSK